MIIGITGKRGHGKDAFATALRPFGFKRIASADPVKRIAQALFALSEGQVHGTQAEKEAIDERWGVSARWILQRIGTEVGREGKLDVFEEWAIGPSISSVRGAFQLEGIEPGDPDCWINALRAKVEREPGDYAVTDVRFPNEAEAVRKLGGQVVKIVRFGGLDGDAASAHASEASVDAIHEDALIYNVGTLADLAAKARMVAIGARSLAAGKA